MATASLTVNDYELDAKFPTADIVTHTKNGPSEQSGCWKWKRKLGWGGQGAVTLQENTDTGQLRAVKKLEAVRLSGDGSNNVNVERELAHLVTVRGCPQLFVQFFGWYRDENKNFLFIAMEYLECGDLWKHIRRSGPLEEKDAREVARQLSEGLAELHQRGICHRDVKPQNILIASRSPICVKLADFGLSKSTIGTDPHTKVGTWKYLAPEQRQFGPQPSLPRDAYTKDVDMWAFGCLIHYILTSQSPFGEGQNKFNERFRQFCEGSLPLALDLLGGMSAESIDFVIKLLVVDPRLRMTAPEALSHKWLLDI